MDCYSRDDPLALHLRLQGPLKGWFSVSHLMLLTVDQLLNRQECSHELHLDQLSAKQLQLDTKVICSMILAPALGLIRTTFWRAKLVI